MGMRQDDKARHISLPTTVTFDGLSLSDCRSDGNAPKSSGFCTRSAQYINAYSDSLSKKVVIVCEVKLALMMHMELL